MYALAKAGTIVVPRLVSSSHHHVITLTMSEKSSVHTRAGPSTGAGCQRGSSRSRPRFLARRDIAAQQEENLPSWRWASVRCVSCWIQQIRPASSRPARRAGGRRTAACGASARRCWWWAGAGTRRRSSVGTRANPGNAVFVRALLVNHFRVLGTASQSYVVGVSIVSCDRRAWRLGGRVLRPVERRGTASCLVSDGGRRLGDPLFRSRFRLPMRVDSPWSSTAATTLPPLNG